MTSPLPLEELMSWVFELREAVGLILCTGRGDRLGGGMGEGICLREGGKVVDAFVGSSYTDLCSEVLVCIGICSLSCGARPA